MTDSTSYSGSQNYLTEVGAFTQEDSYYGTFDQGGNVWEWNDTIIGSSHGLRGSSWDFDDYYLRASSRGYTLPTDEVSNVGFRVATVPEPTVSVSLMLAGGCYFLGERNPLRFSPLTRFLCSWGH